MKTLTRSIVILAALLAALSGCGGDDDKVVNPPPDPVPAATSPEGVVRRLEWAWDHRDTTLYRDLFTADYRFLCSPDSVAGDVLTRDEELIVGRHLFSGGGAEPRATSIFLSFPTLTVAPDPRPGKDPGWHKEVTTAVNLSVIVTPDDYHVTGFTRFYVVRGDSAQIPADMVARGFVPDANRWYVEAWHDETLQTLVPAALGPAGSEVTRAVSWCELKFTYLP